MRILYGVLNMGLGHATRSLVLIRFLLQQGHTLYVVSHGRSLLLLKDELKNSENITFLELKDYEISYSHKIPLMIKLGFQIPKLLKCVHQERKRTNTWVKDLNIDVIFSDHRYGLRHDHIPSYFITHQIAFAPPWSGRFLWKVSAFFHSFLLNAFTGILIPDVPDAPGLSGSLSHGYQKRYQSLIYIGPLSSLCTDISESEPIDILCIVSGPEPLREQFEKKMCRILEKIPGMHVLVAGRPGESNSENSTDHVSVYPHISRSEMAVLMKSAHMVISRSGYSSLMDYVGLNANVIVVPTPGQTEQEYLAELWVKSGRGHAIKQTELSAEKIVEIMNTTLPVAENEVRPNALFRKEMTALLEGKR